MYLCASVCLSMCELEMSEGKIFHGNYFIQSFIFIINQ